MGAWRNSTKTQQSGYAPKSEPEVKNGSSGGATERLCTNVWPPQRAGEVPVYAAFQQGNISYMPSFKNENLIRNQLILKIIYELLEPCYLQAGSQLE